MDRRTGGKLFAIGSILLFAVAVVVVTGPCMMLLDYGLDTVPGQKQSWSLLLVLWAAAELLATPFLIGSRLNRAQLPTGTRAVMFIFGIVVILGGMAAVAITFGSRISWLGSPWPLVVAGALAIIAGTRLARRALFPPAD